MTVLFNYSDWSTRYPELIAVSSDLAQLYFNEACLYCDNTGASKVTDEGVRAMLLNMLTAHIASLNCAALGGRAAENLVGRISNASEGSVSIGLDVGATPGTAAWFMQSKYGAQFWQATAQYRMARVYRGQPRNMDPYNPFYG
jgi:hypothetical protein